jgi:uncharacterized protein YchJ
MSVPTIPVEVSDPEFATDLKVYLEKVVANHLEKAIVVTEQGFFVLVEPGRNEPCFCGSGKKYKKCCGG